MRDPKPGRSTVTCVPASNDPVLVAAALPPIPDLAAAIARLRQIAAEAGDHLLLGDGPPHPDAKLLDLCAEAAAAHKEQQAAGKAWEGKPFFWPHDPARAEYDAKCEAEKRAERNYASLLREAGKLPAATAQGIYAKALAVRASKTGAATLAHSLAEDLIANPALRMALWAADPEAAPVPAGNVVPLAVRSRGGEARP